MSEIDTSKWQAFLCDGQGFVATDEETFKEWLTDGVGTISIRRGGALPSERDGRMRIGDWKELEVFGEVGVEFIEEENRAEAWELAQRAAWGMNQPADAVEKLTRERDSLARRCAVRSGETEQAPAALKLCQQRHDLALREIREVVKSDGPIEVRDVEAIREALEMDGCTACPPGCPSCTVNAECGCDVHPDAAESSADPVEATNHG